MMEKKRNDQILGAAPRDGCSAAFAALIFAGLLLAGCGQKGPLMLPSTTPTKASAPASEVERAPTVRPDSASLAPR
jgi:predicted small lipoprotein YifL